MPQSQPEQGWNAAATARTVFRQHGGVLRTGQALRAGIHPRTLYEMRDAGGPL